MLLLILLSVLLTWNTLRLLLTCWILLIHGTASHAPCLWLLTHRVLLLYLFYHAAANVFIQLLRAFWYQLWFAIFHLLRIIEVQLLSWTHKFIIPVDIARIYWGFCSNYGIVFHTLLLLLLLVLLLLLLDSDRIEQAFLHSVSRRVRLWTCPDVLC